MDECEPLATGEMEDDALDRLNGKNSITGRLARVGPGKL